MREDENGVSEWDNLKDAEVECERLRETLTYEVNRLAASLRRLNYAAQTTGGTPGPDRDLQGAIGQAEWAIGCADTTLAAFVAGQQGERPQSYDKTLSQQGTPDSLGHITRFSDSTTYDEKCVLCGTTDGRYGHLDKPCPNAAAGQQGEREDGMADVSWKRQLERTRNDAWNAALEAATQATEDEDGDLYTKPIPLRTRLKTIIAPSRSLRDTARVIRRNATAEIRSLKRGTP